MELLRSPKNKLLAASAMLVVLAVAASAKGIDAGGIARWVLGAAAIAGIAFWFVKARSAGAKFALPGRLQVISRAGLSPKCGVALVEADGRTYLVVYGDGFAEVSPAPAVVTAKARRPRRAKGGAR